MVIIKTIVRIVTIMENTLIVFPMGLFHILTHLIRSHHMN